MVFLGVVVLMILIPTVATERASAKFVFTHFNTDNGDGIGSKVYIFVLGLLMTQYTLSGYDASAHMVSSFDIIMCRDDVIKDSYTCFIKCSLSVK